MKALKRRGFIYHGFTFLGGMSHKHGDLSLRVSGPHKRVNSLKLFLGVCAHEAFGPRLEYRKSLKSWIEEVDETSVGKQGCD